jgi:long-chain acyl-CoA synthetase
VRRSFVAERYAPLVAALYSGASEADIATEVTFEDGRKGMLSAHVRIRDVEADPRAGVLERAA